MGKSPIVGIAPLTLQSLSISLSPLSRSLSPSYTAVSPPHTHFNPPPPLLLCLLTVTHPFSRSFGLSSLLHLRPFSPLPPLSFSVRIPCPTT